MKNQILKLLRTFAPSTQSRTPVGLLLLLLLIGIALVAMIPLYPLWALQLIGLPVEVSLKSYLGSILLLGFYLWIRSLSGKPPKS